jgi:hypothetical protein
MVAFSKLPGIVALCIVVFTKTLGSAAPVPNGGAAQAGVSKSTSASGGGSMAPVGDENVYVQVLKNFINGG